MTPVYRIRFNFRETGRMGDLSGFATVTFLLTGALPCVTAAPNALKGLKSVIEGIFTEPRKLAVVVVCASIVVIAIFMWLVHVIAGCVRKRRLRKTDRRGTFPQPLSSDISVSELEDAQMTTKVASPTPSRSNPSSCTSLKSPFDDAVNTFNIRIPARPPSPRLSKGASRGQIPGSGRCSPRSQGQDNSWWTTPCLPSSHLLLKGEHAEASENHRSVAVGEQNPSSDTALIACQGGPRRAHPNVYWVSQGSQESRGRYHSNSSHGGQQRGTGPSVHFRDVGTDKLTHTIAYPSKCVQSPSKRIPQDYVAGVSVTQHQHAVSRNPTDTKRQHVRRVNLPNRYHGASLTLPVNGRPPPYNAISEG
ncbi:hypothetical protein EDC04DRAFT_392450 [Pisolithus marmoratus]|nr:hypothetical protein EDC04DRAFT_392450 [Pisolithus marmoratus]